MDKAMIIPPPQDLEAMAQFFDEHPDWSPAFDENGVQTGVRSPWIAWNYGLWMDLGFNG